MKQIITISMEMKENKEKVELKFQAGINTLGGAITEEVANKIHEKIADITQIVSDAIEKDVNQKEEEVTSEMEGFLNLLDELADIEKKKIDEFEKGLEKLDTIEEKLDYTLDAILKEILGR